MPAASKQLYLTFDDGPIAGPTEFVLETLQKFNASATFFCIGDNVRKYPEIYRRIAAQGHAIGNHTYHHLNGWNTKTTSYIENVMLCDAELRQHAAGIATTNNLFRPPYGRVTRDQIAHLSQFRVVMWDVLSIDYNLQLAPEKCLRNSIAATRDGSIIVFHDSLKAARNLMYALPRFVEHFSEMNYHFNIIPHGKDSRSTT
jgi:peptidoglycan/xylan/chitin deacetylase (PgdA/CDA1 family)